MQADGERCSLMNNKTKALLAAYAAHYEVPAFMEGDPSWFMHQVEGPRNQEAMAFVSACLSYGNRRLFMPKIRQLLDLSAGNMHAWIATGAYGVCLPDTAATFYRLQTCHHMRQLLDALRALYAAHGTLGCYCQAQGATTGLAAIEVMTRYFSLWDVGHLVPRTANSSCKRLCMFLRWMARDDSPVDLGLWPFIDKRSLLIPLDTHVLREATRLGLVSGKSATMRTVIRLTDELRQVFPADPLRGDFALFGYGIEHS